MHGKVIAVLIAGAVFLMGCADTGHYPISGDVVGPQDQVRFMSVPDIARY